MAAWGLAAVEMEMVFVLGKLGLRSHIGCLFQLWINKARANKLVSNKLHPTPQATVTNAKKKYMGKTLKY